MKSIVAILLFCVIAAECRYNKFSSTTIKYKFMGISNGNQMKVKRALNKINDASCMNFVEDADVNSGQHITFKNGRGCYSHLGAMKSGNDVVLGNGCFFDNIIQKEVMHAMGFVNEINRLDRDNFIRIHFENVRPSHRHAFRKAHGRTMNEVTEYDFRSVLQYRENAFSMKGDRVIEAIDSANQSILGKATGLSKLDVQKIKKNYC